MICPKKNIKFVLRKNYKKIFNEIKENFPMNNKYKKNKNMRPETGKPKR